MIQKKEDWNQIPFPHVVVDEYEDISELLNAISNEKFEHKKSDLFSLFQSISLKDSIYTKEILEKIKTDMQKATGETFSDIDAHATIYADTDFLLPHDDQLEGRRYAYLLYLTDIKEEQGGALALFDKDCEKVITRVQPKTARLAIFEVSNISYHSVEEVMGDVQRIALGGWLHD